MSFTVPNQVAPEGPGSASGAPSLPMGFADTFTSRYIDAGDVASDEMLAALTEFFIPSSTAGDLSERRPA